MRGRRYTQSPSPPPPRGHDGRRGPSPSPRGGGRYRDLSATLFVRNLSHDCRARLYSIFYHEAEDQERKRICSCKRQAWDFRRFNPNPNLLPLQSIEQSFAVPFVVTTDLRPPRGTAMRGRSYIPSPSPPPPPPRGHGRRGPSPSPRDRARSRDLRTSLFVRQLSRDCREEDLRKSFKQFGPLKDIHLPRDHHTGYPRRFGFVKFEDPADAAEAKDHMDGYVLLGRKMAVEFAENNRKTPTEMRAKQRGDGRTRDRRRSRSRYYSSSPRSSRSPPPSRRHHSRKEGYDRRRRSYSRSPAKNGSRGRSETPATSKSRSISRSPRRSISRSPRRNRSRSLRRRRSNTPLPTSRNRSRRPRRRRSNTPLPGRSSSPRGKQ
ncbi:hypothetical protein YC2023_044049 [Brassica napus]|uniref:(rape) hypothetical protein n=1 Tax=Brassica napus TaxID=3708 RepID=A0A816III5_BRANA|nr:unnamed protein product [Brassica napus]